MTSQAIARILAIAAFSGCAAITLAVPAEAVPIVTVTPLAATCNSGNQSCPSQGTTIKTTGEDVQVTFQADDRGCSDIQATVTIDNKVVADGHLGPGGKVTSTPPVPLAAGNHVLRVKAEGIAGGCNTGKLTSWAGAVQVIRLVADPAPEAKPAPVADPAPEAKPAPVAGPDRDGDGLSDSDEFKKYFTSPFLADTDFDGVNDGDEVANGTNPLLFISR